MNVLPQPKPLFMSMVCQHDKIEEAGATGEEDLKIQISSTYEGGGGEAPPPAPPECTM